MLKIVFGLVRDDTIHNHTYNQVLRRKNVIK